MSDMRKIQAWLERLAAEKRQRRYRDARIWEEWHVPFDVKPVSPESAVIVARLLGSIRMEWHRESAPGA
jgi:hypothetical protein